MDGKLQHGRRRRIREWEVDDCRMTTTKCIYSKSTVTQCLSPCPNWDPHPLSRKRVCPPPPRNQRGGGAQTHSPACEGVGESQFGRLEKNLGTLSTL
jgi:hypothetical protein